MADREKAHLPAKDVDGRYPSRFRYSRRTIRTWTNVCFVLIFSGFAGGIVVAMLAYSLSPDSEPTNWVLALALGILVGGVGLGLLIAAWLGGQSIMRGGGFVGILLVVGIFITATGKVDDNAAEQIVGWSILALAVLGFWIIGWVAKVPMWIGLPGWPRLLTVQRGTKHDRTPPPEDAPEVESGAPPAPDHPDLAKPARH